MPAINGYWRKGMSRADAAYLTLTAEVIANTCAAISTSGSTRSAMTTRAGGWPRI